MSNGADRYLKENREVIVNTAGKLLRQIDYVPSLIYRGVLLKDAVEKLFPNVNMAYCSFSECEDVARHFASINGFGSELIDLKSRLGEYGYIIRYTPKFEEVIFHHLLLEILPFSEALDLIGMDGYAEIQGLKRQREITILQPEKPFTNLNQFTEAMTSHSFIFE